MAGEQRKAIDKDGFPMTVWGDLLTANNGHPDRYYVEYPSGVATTVPAEEVSFIVPATQLDAMERVCTAAKAYMAPFTNAHEPVTMGANSRLDGLLDALAALAAAEAGRV